MRSAMFMKRYCDNRNFNASVNEIIAMPSHCVFRHNPRMIKMTELKAELKRRSKTQKALAEFLGLDASAVNRICTGERQVKAGELAKILEFLGISYENSEGPINKKEVNEDNFARIPEIDVRGGLGVGGTSSEAYTTLSGGSTILTDVVSDVWGVPFSSFPTKLRNNSDDMVIIQVDGNSMEPNIYHGDYVMIDKTSAVPRADGIYALWNGLGIVCKRVRYVYRSEPPRIKIISDNQTEDEPAEVTLEEAKIIGKVVWIGRWL